MNINNDKGRDSDLTEYWSVFWGCWNGVCNDEQEHREWQQNGDTQRYLVSRVRRKPVDLAHVQSNQPINVFINSSTKFTITNTLLRICFLCCVNAYLSTMKSVGEQWTLCDHACATSIVLWNLSHGTVFNFYTVVTAPL